MCGWHYTYGQSMLNGVDACQRTYELTIIGTVAYDPRIRRLGRFHVLSLNTTQNAINTPRRKQEQKISISRLPTRLRAKPVR